MYRYTLPDSVQPGLLQRHGLLPVRLRHQLSLQHGVDLRLPALNSGGAATNPDTVGAHSKCRARVQGSLIMFLSMNRALFVWQLRYFSLQKCSYILHLVSTRIKTYDCHQEIGNNCTD